MKKNRGTPLYLWVEEKMSMVMNRNRNVEQNIGLRPHFSVPIFRGMPGRPRKQGIDE
ncbi:hypothetical protein [Methylobacter tundripaludum]|uniref:Uncharacterized protein n=1 Tax=Methylobacter tundripaludum (strain ATCC BAA-1195 / DSM 17260 / SV96) TaxID=697282 RepID=G3IQI2_METTV|nr:hypothetical protein [Methylobacter tundripaludum]EGW22068.1 hypothetical protein Mettu_0866 [Methylobacter tundripaludum SV96]